MIEGWNSCCGWRGSRTDCPPTGRLRGPFPGGQPHGRHAVAAHHAGDLPSLQADARGVAQFRFEAASIAVGSGANDIIGKGLIVHRDSDDYTTQPTGNAGPRLACAVIAGS